MASLLDGVAYPPCQAFGGAASGGAAGADASDHTIVLLNEFSLSHSPSPVLSLSPCMCVCARACVCLRVRVRMICSAGRSSTASSKDSPSVISSKDTTSCKQTETNHGTPGEKSQNNPSGLAFQVFCRQRKLCANSETSKLCSTPACLFA